MPTLLCIPMLVVLVYYRDVTSKELSVRPPRFEFLISIRSYFCSWFKNLAIFDVVLLTLAMIGLKPLLWVLYRAYIRQISGLMSKSHLGGIYLRFLPSGLMDFTCWKPSPVTILKTSSYFLFINNQPSYKTHPFINTALPFGEIRSSAVLYA